MDYSRDSENFTAMVLGVVRHPNYCFGGSIKSGHFIAIDLHCILITRKANLMCKKLSLQKLITFNNCKNSTWRAALPKYAKIS